MSFEGAVTLASIAGMFFLSFVGLYAFGPPRTTLKFTRDEKAAWNRRVRRGWFGAVVTKTNIIGTLTSFATVLLFFIGSSKLFGLGVLATVAALVVGIPVTNLITTRISQIAKVAKIQADDDQVGAVLPGLFRPEWQDGARTARVVRWVTIANVVGIIWLEFSLFSQLLATVLDVTTPTGRALIIGLVALTVFYFILKYGIRGVVFSDVFQTPIIIFGVLAIGAVVFFLASTADIPAASEVLAPVVPTWVLALFVVHVFSLNAFLVVCGEAHWLRVWVFGDQETEQQASSILGTALLWSILIAIGFGVFIVTGSIGDSAVADLVARMGDSSVAWLTVFWLAASAALFSTADTQAYSCLLLAAYRPESGTLDDTRLSVTRPFMIAASAALVFSLLFFGVLTLEVPFTKLVFLVIPFSLAVTPALVRLALHRTPSAVAVWVSVVGFSVAGGIGLGQPDTELAWTLTAGIIPLIVAAVMATGGESVV